MVYNCLTSKLDIVNRELGEYGIKSKVDNGQLRTGGYNPEDGSVEYHLWTLSYVEFREMHDRFYRKWYDIDTYSKRYWHEDKYGDWYVWRKIVPRDVCLSPVCVANWYKGDGSISDRKSVV